MTEIVTGVASMRPDLIEAVRVGPGQPVEHWPSQVGAQVAGAAERLKNLLPMDPVARQFARLVAAAAPPGLAEPLTDRETDVLRRIAAKSNQGIAHDLVVTLDTVKKHVSHVLGKLGAANRTEAETWARQLGLIP